MGVGKGQDAGTGKPKAQPIVGIGTYIALVGGIDLTRRLLALRHR